MYRKATGADPLTERWLDFTVRDIMGTWVSREGMPKVRVYRNTARKGGGYWMELTYNPQAVFTRPIIRLFDVRYFDLYGRIGIAYDAERDKLLLSHYGEYEREG
jgi:hypothetical protein